MSLFIHDNADKVPPRPAEAPHRLISGADFDSRRRASIDFPWHVSVALSIVLLALLGLVVWWLVGWAARNPGVAETGQLLLLTLIFALAVAGAAWAIVALYLSLVARYGQALRAHVERTRLGNAAPLQAIVGQSIRDVQAIEAAAIGLELGRAPYTKYPLLSTLSEGNKESAETTIYGTGEGSETPGGVPSADWLRWIDETPHLMIAGRTNAGKTTLASAILAERIQAGDEALIIDPHDQPDKWFGVAAIGGGRRYDEILLMLDQVVAEMDARYQAYNDGTPTSAFSRLTVLVDEVPAIMDACLNEHRRIVDGRWSQFARKLGSEARKVRISVILLTQSPLVQDIGLNIQMRKNFSRIALGDETRRLLSEERNTDRRKQLEELIRGQAHPAVMEYQSEIHVLNTADVPTLAQQDVRPFVRAWRPSVRASAQPPTQTAPSGRTDSGRTLTQDRIKLYLIELARRGRSREWARQWAQDHGLRFENQLWTEALEEARKIEAL
jgi:hypothetical protein